MTDQDCQRAYSVQVKTNSTKQPDWLLNKRAKDIVSKQYVYVFVDAVDDKDVEMFPVHSKVVAAKMTETAKPNSTWYAFNRERFARPYKDKWGIFGKAATEKNRIVSHKGQSEQHASMTEYRRALVPGARSGYPGRRDIRVRLY